MKALAILLPVAALAAEITLDKPMSPPTWALLERQLLKEASVACERFGDKYLD
jgi:hypothetical protein